MKKVYVLFFLIFGCVGVRGQIYVNTFNGVSACPTNGNTPTMALNSTGTSVTRSTVTCTATANVFNSTTLNATASISNTSYIEFSATADPGYQLNLTTVSFLRQGSNTAPNQIEVRYSTDGFVTSTTWGAAPLTPIAGAVATWDFADLSTAGGGTVAFRIYPYGTQRCDLTAPAAASTGTFRVDDVTINGTVAVSGGPTISVTPTSLSGFTAAPGVPSAEQTYTVGGTGLTTDIIITPPVGFEIATVSGGPYTVNPASITLTQTGGIVTTQTIYVRMNSAVIGTNTGNITHTSAGSNNPNVALTGNVVPLIPLVYVWVGLNGDWQVPINWAPPRLFPATNDSLLFISSLADVITNVPTQTVGYIGASLSTNTTLQAATSGNTLTIGNLAGPDFFVEAGSSFNINTANALTLNLVTGATASVNGTMTFTAGGHKISAADAGAIVFNSGAVFTAGTGFTGNAFGTVTANSAIFSSGSVYRHISGGNPFVLTQPASVVVFQTGSLYKQESILTPSVSGRVYANYEVIAPSLSPINASGASLLKMDNVTITNGSISFSMTGGFDLKGNVSVAAGDTLRFAPTSAATLTFNGTTAQSISNAGTLTFGANQDVVINNAAGLTLNAPVTLSRILTFTSGLINTTTPNLLTLNATALVTGVSNASFVNGPVSKIGNTLFTFPVGKTNCGPTNSVNGYAPLSISAPATITDQFTAEYVHSSGSALGAITAVGLQKVSACDYWKLDKVSAGPNTIDVTLNWNDAVNNCTTASPYVNNLPSLVVAHFDAVSSKWNTYGATSTALGTPASGTVVYPGVSVFSPFAIGSIDFNNPLPITINYFTGTRSNGNHLLNWKVTCVSVPSATIEMERSTDGRNYSSIYSIFATALRCQQPFNYTDAQPAKGTNYYRLKMTDADGKVTYSTVVPLINATKGIDVMTIAPNPVVNSAFNLQISSADKTQMELVITDMQGRIVRRQSVNLIAGFNTIPMNVKNLAAGTYQLFGYAADEKTRVLRFVIQ